MSLQNDSGALGEGALQQPPSQPATDASAVSNPILTPSCSAPASHRSASSSRRGSVTPPAPSAYSPSVTPPSRSTPPRSHTPGTLSPKLTVRTPISSARNSISIASNAISANSVPRPPSPPPRSPSRSATPRSRTSPSSSAVRTPIADQSPRIPSSGGVPQYGYSKSAISMSNIPLHSFTDVSSERALTPSETPLSTAVSHILSFSPGSARTYCHLCPTSTGCLRTCCHVRPRTANRELRLGPQHHQVEPYARSRKADPHGYLFTCYLDYSRSIKPPPPSCFDSYVRPESLQYSTCNSACDTPRSSSSLSSSFSPFTGGHRLYSRPPTPVPLSRAKEVHRIAMAGIPVDVKELANCYLFVAEIPGLKNTDVKVQVENDSILKISGDRKREDCEDCEVKYIRVERQSGRFARKFNLPANADLEKISAACQDGILSVVVPKNPPPEQRKPKNLDIKIAT